MTCYQVGGSVRDSLLGLPCKDRDWVVTGVEADEMTGRGFKRVGADFPVFLHPENGEEYALARTERKTGPGYRGFETRFGSEVTLEEDLARRDLTINAMALDREGQLIDPYAGMDDLKAKRLRHVSNAFSEDPLRVLRAARFLARFDALGFRLATDTLVLMERLASSGELTHLTPERVWQETQKGLATQAPSIYFATLRACGALESVFPELAALIGQHQPPEHHPEGDAWVHSLMVLDMAARLSDRGEVRFAALVHDLGKGLTPLERLPHHYGHESRGADLVMALCERLRVPGHYRKLAVLTARHHLRCHRVAEMRPKKVVKLLRELDGFRNPARFELFLLACEADARGRGGAENLYYAPADEMRGCLAACQDIDLKKIAKTGVKGAHFGLALHRARISAIKCWWAEQVGSVSPAAECP
ncbi:MAG: multifunctional CCA addition/repair protein [Magnetococcales bacterium]|nr:multifunctional CCA addition/repair protein [Magnetococcales bacterium]